MDCYLVDILYLSEAFRGARMGNCDITPTDDATIFAFAYLEQNQELNQERKMKNAMILKGFEPGSVQLKFRLVTTTPTGTSVYYPEFYNKQV